MKQRIPSGPRNSLFRPGLTAGLVGSAVVAFLLLTDRLSAQYGLRESQRVFDDLAGGIIVGLLIYYYERRRSQFLTERLKIIGLMNHHVRNALQGIIGSVYARGQDEQLNKMQSSIYRIEWALREILPGKVLDDYDDNAAEKKGQSPAA